MTPTCILGYMRQQERIRRNASDKRFLRRIRTSLNLNKIKKRLPTKKYKKRVPSYSLSPFYKIKYKKNFILNKKSVLFKGHNQRVLFFLRLKDKRYLTASRSEIIIWNQNNFKPTNKIQMKEEDKITKIIQLSNEEIIIACNNTLMKYKLGEDSYKTIKKINEKEMIYDMKEIAENIICVLFFNKAYLVNLNKRKRITIEEIENYFKIDDLFFTFNQILQINQDNFIIFAHRIMYSFIYNIANKTTTPFSPFSSKCDFDYLSSIHLLKDDKVLVDSGRNLTVINLKSNSEEVEKKNYQICKNTIIQTYRGNSFAGMKLLINNKEYYIRRIEEGYAIIDSDSLQICTVIPEKDNDETFIYPMEKFEEGVFMCYGNNGYVYTIE